MLTPVKGATEAGAAVKVEAKAVVEEAVRAAGAVLKILLTKRQNGNFRARHRRRQRISCLKQEVCLLENKAAQQIELQRVESTAQKPQIDYLVNGVHIVHDRETNKVIFGKEDCAAAGISSLDIPEDINACIDLTKKQKALATVLRTILSSEQPYVAFRMEDLVGDDTVPNFTKGFSVKHGGLVPLAYTAGSDSQQRTRHIYKSVHTSPEWPAYVKVGKTIGLLYGSRKSLGLPLGIFTTTETTDAIVAPHLDLIRSYSSESDLAYKQLIFYSEVKGLKSTLELYRISKEQLNIGMMRSEITVADHLMVEFPITPEDEGLVVAWNGSEDYPILHGVSPITACGEEEGPRIRKNMPIIIGT